MLRETCRKHQTVNKRKAMYSTDKENTFKSNNQIYIAAKIYLDPEWLSRLSIQLLILAQVIISRS